MKLTLLCLCLFCCLKSKAQVSYPAFKTLRYQEDYSFLKDDTALSAYKRIKFIPLSKTGVSYVSFGGEIRYQYFNIRNEDWGAASQKADGFVFSRMLVHLDAHIAKKARAFFQLQSSMANNKATGTSPIDENPLELHQGFVDFQTTDNKWVLRLGRQELSYGSQRLVAVRELPNNRQSFDGAKLVFATKQFQEDVFYSRYVVAKKNLFDDASGKNIQFWGGYFVARNIRSFSNVDLYYLALKKTRAKFADGSGEEVRHSVGARFWKDKQSIRYDLEGLYQFGSFSNKKIHAWTLSANAGYRFRSLPLLPEFGLKTEVISGDEKTGDDELQTFNPLFPRGAYFGLAALIGPANLVDVHPSLNLKLWKEKLECTIDYDVFWRHRSADGIYGPNVALLFPSPNVATKFIGNQLEMDFTFVPNPFILFRFETTWFHAGNYLKVVSPGKDILFFGVTSQLKF